MALHVNYYTCIRLKAVCSVAEKHMCRNIQYMFRTNNRFIHSISARCKKQRSSHLLSDLLAVHKRMDGWTLAQYRCFAMSGTHLLPRRSQLSDACADTDCVHDKSIRLKQSAGIDMAALHADVLKKKQVDAVVSCDEDRCIITNNMHSGPNGVVHNFVNNPKAEFLGDDSSMKRDIILQISSQENGLLEEVEKFDLELANLPPPKPMEPKFNLAPFVLQSAVLQKLVSLGVDLNNVEKVNVAADFIVKCSWEADIQPRLLLLKDVGVADSQLGQVVSKNPLLLSEDVDNMQIRINYLVSKKFSKEQLSRVVTKAPLTLIMPVAKIDAKLGFLQNGFHLTGDEVRLVVNKLPKLIPWQLQKLKDIRFCMKEFLGFSDKEQKAVLLHSPKVYLSDRHQIDKQFDFLYNTMGLTHHQLVQWPGIFRTRLHIIKQRHRFLLLLGRAQYNVSKENYVSLQALVSGRDADFCTNVAKVSLEKFQNFLKCL